MLAWKLAGSEGLKYDVQDLVKQKSPKQEPITYLMQLQSSVKSLQYVRMQVKVQGFLISTSSRMSLKPAFFNFAYKHTKTS